MASEESGMPADSDGEPLSDQGALARTEKIFVRLTFWQTVLSVAGVIVAILALYAALTESSAVRQQTAASVWPFLQLSIEDHDSGDDARFMMSLTNAGVGPARLRGMRVTVAGETIRGWRELVERLAPGAGVDRNFVTGRVLRPDETVAMFATSDTTLARALQSAIAEADSSIQFCYCSIFDDCWLADSDRDLQDPEPIAQCPDYGDTAYRD